MKNINSIFVDGWKIRLTILQEYLQHQDKETGKTLPIDTTHQEWLGFTISDIISEMEDELKATET